MKRYLHRATAFCLLVSLISVVSKNILPKLFNVLGIVLWMLFYLHPQLPKPLKYSQMMEYLAIIGGLLFIGGCEFFEKEFTFADLASVEVTGEKE